MAIGLTFVIANGDIDLSVGSVLALSGSTAAFLMKFMGWAPSAGRRSAASPPALLAGCVNGLLATVRFCLPAFVATLGMFYIARGLAAWLVAGRQLCQLPGELQPDRPQADRGAARASAIEPAPGGLLYDVASALSTQSILLVVLALDRRHRARPRPPSATWSTPPAATARAAEYAGIDTDAVRFWSLVFCAACASLAGLIYVAYFRSFNPSAGQLRELDGIASVIIGGGSIFGGYGTIIGSLAGAPSSRSCARCSRCRSSCPTAPRSSCRSTGSMSSSA